ncbi:MAG: hypothetical protein IJ491_05995 [Clostridia bacterium]|nr:hypothetical protein [Clostridia bacterium]
MKNKLLIIIPIIILVIALAAIGISQKDSSTTTLSAESTEAEKTGITINLTPDTKSLVVYAPLHCEVLFGSQQVPYDETVKCYRLFTEEKGKHIVTISRYGCHTVEKEVDFTKQNSAELHIDLQLTDEYKKELQKVAEENLRRFIEICDNGSGDLSSFSFYTDEDKTKAQAVIDSVTENLSVDSMHYETGKINIAALRCDGIAEGSETIPASYDSRGSVVKFTLDYNYTWKYKNTEDNSSGVNSEIQNPFIKMEYIDGEWYVREIYLYLRKR